MKKLKRQDRNGTRTSEELRRRYKLEEIELTIEEVEILKNLIKVDNALSITSTNPVQNKIITQALNNKVNAIDGMGLSANDFTDILKLKLDSVEERAQKNIIESISVNGVEQAITDKNVNLTIEASISDEDKQVIEANTAARHTHSNKSVLDGINANKVSRWNNVAYYESGGSTNVNTTTEELVLSSTNTPDSSLWYVQTIFYSSKSASSNRVQIAYGYNQNKPIMSRYYFDGSWSEWYASDIISSSISDYEGYIWYANGVLEQWGRANITPTAANTVTNATIYYPITYDNIPDVSAIPQIATPNAVTWSIGAGSTTAAAKQGMVIYMTRTNTSSTSFRWKAKGKRNPF